MKLQQRTRRALFGPSCGLLLLAGCSGEGEPPVVQFSSLFLTVDLDGDGVLGDVDCDDQNAARAPGQLEIPYDGVDQDCDGSDAVDLDGDGFAALAAGGPDCDDQQSTVHPQAEEVQGDGIDQNCDGRDDVDADNDGVLAQEGDCDDSDPNASPDLPELPDGFDNDCDGTVDELPYSGSLDVMQLSTQQSGRSAWQFYGFSLGMVPDMTRDGLPELMVGISGADQIQLVPGSGTLWQDSAAWPTQALIVGELGSGVGSVAPAVTDLNGDGWADIAIPAPWQHDQAGRVWLLSGEPWPIDSKLSLPAIATPLDGDVQGAGLGAAVLGSADFDADGFQDLWLAAPNSVVNGEASTGQLYLYRGRPASQRQGGRISELASATLAGSQGNSYFGTALATTDWNQDGRPDLLVGAPGNAGTITGLAGRVGVFLNRGAWDTLHSLTDADAILVDDASGASSAQFGATLATGCDVNGDALPDLLVGSPRAGSDGAEERGRVSLFLGTGERLPQELNSSQADGSWLGEGQGDQAGTALSCAGDLNGDGFDDIVIGAAGAANQNGAVYVVYGGKLPWPHDASLAQLGVRIQSSLNGALLGFAATLGDVTGDGLSDLVVGAPGYSSSAGSMAGLVSLLQGAVDP